MSATFELFARWKAAKGYTTDTEAAKALHIHVSTITPWKLHGRNGSPAVIERMAKDLGEDPIQVILQAFAEAARDAADRKTLGRLARSLGAACLALAMLPLWPHQSAVAATDGHEINTHVIHYAQWLLRRLVRRVTRFLAFERPTRALCPDTHFLELPGWNRPALSLIPR